MGQAYWNRSPLSFRSHGGQPLRLLLRPHDAAQRRVEKKLRKAVDNLLRIESYALRHGAIFGPVHDTLIDAINCLDTALSDYDGRINRWPVAKIGYKAARARAGQQE
jgi:hypothetical protein